ncbi:hypothetical protein Tco_1448232 [Tanacetum coccineum]
MIDCLITREGITLLLISLLLESTSFGTSKATGIGNECDCGYWHHNAANIGLKGKLILFALILLLDIEVSTASFDRYRTVHGSVLSWL